jgi:hypothetical protein
MSFDYKDTDDWYMKDIEDKKEGNDEGEGERRRGERTTTGSGGDDFGKNKNNITIFEVLDELISHMNTTRNIFTLLILSSFILAPLALIVAGILILHPLFLYRILFRLPAIGGILLLFISVSIILASIWLFIGVNEQRFFSQWNKKFSRYMSKKRQVDKELAEDQ